MENGPDQKLTRSDAIAYLDRIRQNQSSYLSTLTETYDSMMVNIKTFKLNAIMVFLLTGTNLYFVYHFYQNPETYIHAIFFLIMAMGTAGLLCYISKTLINANNFVQEILVEIKFATQTLADCDDAERKINNGELDLDKNTT